MLPQPIIYAANLTAKVFSRSVHHQLDGDFAAQGLGIRAAGKPDHGLWETTSGYRGSNPRSTREKRPRADNYAFLIVVMSFKCSSKTGMELSAKLSTSVSFVLSDSVLNALIAFLWPVNMSAM
jgi:hypothetical protein